MNPAILAKLPCFCGDFFLPLVTLNQYSILMTIEERIARQEQWAEDHSISCDTRNVMIQKEFKQNSRDHREMLNGIKEINSCMHERTEASYDTLEKKFGQLMKWGLISIGILLSGYIYIFYNGLPW